MGQNLGVTWITDSYEDSLEEVVTILVDNSILTEYSGEVFEGFYTELKYHSILAFPNNVGIKIMENENENEIVYWFKHNGKGNIVIEFSEWFPQDSSASLSRKEILLSFIEKCDIRTIVEKTDKYKENRIIYSLKVEQHMINHLIQIANYEIETTRYLADQ